MKKIFLLTLLVGILNVSNAEFPDVTWDNLHFDSINYLQENNIVRGFEDGEYKPENFISRSAMLKILVESNFLINQNDISEIESYSDQSCFEDIPANKWFTKYVCWAKDQGWVNGFDGGRIFMPEKNVSLVEGLKLALVNSEIDFPETSRWYKGVVDASSTYNLIPIDSEYFHNYMTRAQMADLIVRHIKHNEGSLNAYLGELADEVSNWNNLKRADSIYNDLNTDCKSEYPLGMISQTQFNFQDGSQDCFNLVRVYPREVGGFPEELGYTMHKEQDYFVIYYKTTIEDQVLIDQLLNSFSYYRENDYEAYGKESAVSQYASQSGGFYVNFPEEKSNFTTIEYPIWYEDERKDTDQSVQRYAEDRFDIAECDAFNWPSLKMFKIVKYYQYCEKLWDGELNAKDVNARDLSDYN